MKIHQVIVEEILNNRPFHDACEAAFLAAGHEIVLPFAGAPVAEPVWTVFTGEIKKGDEWARTDRPGVWKPVSDSIGRYTSDFPNSIFRRRA